MIKLGRDCQPALLPVNIPRCVSLRMDKLHVYKYKNLVKAIAKVSFN